MYFCCYGFTAEVVVIFGIVFIVAFALLGIVRVASGVLATARNALGAMKDDDLSDEEREKIVQAASIKLLGAFFSILLRSVGALLAAFLPIWLAGMTGLASEDAVLAFLSRLDVILITTVVILCMKRGMALFLSRCCIFLKDWPLDKRDVKHHI